MKLSYLLWGALLSAATALPQPAHAIQLMQATVTGTVSAGGDAFLTTVYFGPNTGGNLVGQTASVSIVYDADRFRPNYPGYAPNWTFLHQPNYPSFLGTAGQSPVLSGSFTVNGHTVAMDVSGTYEVARLAVENPPDSGPYGQPDSWGLYGGDRRSTWCPNDGQCSETVQLYANQTYASSDLFGGQHNFDPADSFAAQTAPYRSIGAYVRLYQGPNCPSGLCPGDRFSDNASHWVEFWVNGSSLTVAPLAAVPEPQTYALMLGGLALLGWARRRQGLRSATSRSSPAATAKLPGTRTAAQAAARRLR